MGIQKLTMDTYFSSTPTDVITWCDMICICGSISLEIVIPAVIPVCTIFPALITFLTYSSNIFGPIFQPTNRTVIDDPQEYSRNMQLIPLVQDACCTRFRLLFLYILCVVLFDYYI